MDLAGISVPDLKISSTRIICKTRPLCKQNFRFVGCDKTAPDMGRFLKIFLEYTQNIALKHFRFRQPEKISPVSGFFHCFPKRIALLGRYVVIIECDLFGASDIFSFPSLYLMDS